MQLRFTQTLQLKRRWPRSPVAAEAVVSVLLTACSEAGRTCIKLQRVRAWLQPKAPNAGAPISDGSLEALVARGGMLQSVTVEFCARTPAAGGSAALWHRVTTVNPSTPDEARVVTTRKADVNYWRCDCSSWQLPECKYGKRAHTLAVLACVCFETSHIPSRTLTVFCCRLREATAYNVGSNTECSMDASATITAKGAIYLGFSRSYTEGDQPECADGRLLDLVLLEMLPTPLVTDPAACPATLRLKRNLRHALMAGLQGDELRGIEVQTVR
jgi:hypothetical protein